jgi:hypothetical protein
MRAMSERSSASIPPAVTAERLAWSRYPGVVTTLLAAIAITTLFLGLSSVTSTVWLTWVGLGLMGAVVVLHLWRVWNTRRQRTDAQAHFHAQLIGSCRPIEENAFLKRHNVSEDPLVLLLTEDALQFAYIDPLNIFATLPLYNIEAATLTENGTNNPTLQLNVRTAHDRLYTLKLADFESHAPAPRWAQALAHP